MELRPLGSTGLRVSVLGLGTVKLGRDRGVRYPVPVSIPDDAAARRLLDVARDLGINLLDTAPAYGDAEERLGMLLGAATRDWVIATKVGETFDGGVSRFDFSGAAVRASVQRSLARLRRDCLDIVLVHSDGNDLAVLARGECVGTLLELKRAGLVRAVGFSGKTVEGGIAALRDCDAVMVTYHRDATAEAPVIAAARAAGRGVLVKKPLASGWLVHGQASALAASLQFAAGTAGVSSVVVGTTAPSHLADNVAALAAPPRGA